MDSETFGSFLTLSIVKMSNAMSAANADNVSNAARNAVRDVMRVEVTCDDNENRKATKVTPAATFEN